MPDNHSPSKGQPDKRLPSKRERGQVVILVALMALALVAFVGLALDGGQVYQWRRVMQDAADGGVIAGAYTMTFVANVTDPQISSTIQQYAVVDNRAESFTWSKTGPLASCLTVTTTKNFPSLFIGLIGISNLDAMAHATACAGQPTGSANLWPFAAPVFSYTITSTVPISITNLDWICFTASCGATDLANWIKNGFSGLYDEYPNLGAVPCAGGHLQISQLILPTCLGEKPGTNGDVGQLKPPLCDPAIALGHDFTLPLYDVCADLNGVTHACATGTGNYFHIVGLGRFTFMGIRFNPGNANACYVGNPSPLPDCPGSRCIWGKFKEYVGYNDICTSGCGSYTGFKSVALVN